MDRAPADVLAEHRARGELAFQVDRSGRPLWPPRVGPWTWRTAAPRGVVHAVTRLHPRGEEPRSVCLVDVDGGPRLMASGGAPIGTRVTLRWDGDALVAEP